MARVVKPQGRRGEVAAELFTDFPELFADRRHLWLCDPHGNLREAELEEYWPHKGRMVLKFAGVDSISEAETLVGFEVQISREARAPLKKGSAYVSDLVGCRVEVDGRDLGRITDVHFGAGEAPLLIVRRDEDGKEYMVPLVESFLKEFDLEHKRVRMALPEGLLELEAPLSAEEKAQQQKK